jgi:glycosyltransferase involved in cell wall biosynthesis
MRDGYVIMARDDKRSISLNTKYPLIEFIPNGVDFSTACVSPNDRDAYAKRVGLPKNSYIIGSIGRMVQERNPIAVVEVFSEILLNKRDDDLFSIYFYMGGSGPEWDRVINKFSELGIRDHVVLPGLVENSYVAMASFSLYLTMNVGEITGISGLEAASMGVPVVSIQMLSGYTSKSEDWIWSAEDPKLVACRILEILRNKAELNRLSATQKSYCAEHFSSSGMANKYSLFYKRCLSL